VRSKDHRDRDLFVPPTAASVATEVGGGCPRRPDRRPSQRPSPESRPAFTLPCSAAVPLHAARTNAQVETARAAKYTPRPHTDESDGHAARPYATQPPSVRGERPLRRPCEQQVRTQRMGAGRCEGGGSPPSSSARGPSRLDTSVSLPASRRARPSAAAEPGQPRHRKAEITTAAPTNGQRQRHRTPPGRRDRVRAVKGEYVRGRRAEQPTRRGTGQRSPLSVRAAGGPSLDDELLGRQGEARPRRPPPDDGARPPPPTGPPQTSPAPDHPAQSLKT